MERARKSCVSKKLGHEGKRLHKFEIRLIFEERNLSIFIDGGKE